MGMIYLENTPSPPLAGCIRRLWYCRAPDVLHQRERVLPNGCIQMVISLAADTLTNCNADSPDTPAAPSLLVGARGRYEIIHMRDLAELVGVIFLPGGLGPWLRQRADVFFERSTALEDVWRMPRVRERLREEKTPEQKLARLDVLLVEQLGARNVERRCLVRGALAGLRREGVSETARSLGVSSRRLQQIFSEDAGLSPKLWSRIQRFQRAVSALHAGKPVRWDQLALACGYYDQSHFSNDFRAFSGIVPATYQAQRSHWQNHVALADPAPDSSARDF